MDIQTPHLVTRVFMYVQIACTVYHQNIATPLNINFYTFMQILCCCFYTEKLENKRTETTNHFAVPYSQ